MGRTPGSPDPHETGSPPGIHRVPDGEPYAALRETHTSVVVLVGDRAYKVKKPVALPFLDLSTRAARIANCHREVELNRRIAPDVYLGVAELRSVTAGAAAAGDLADLEDLGDPGEPVVVMRRMPDARRLSSLLADPGRREGARHCVLAVARQVAVFHASLPAVEGYDLVGTMARLWWEGRDQTRPFEGDLLPAEQLDEAYGLAAEYVEGRAQMLRARERSGLVRDGHGDLLTEDVFCLDDGPRVLDCLEFDERLRLGDVLMDIAFLRTDLVLHGAPGLARLVVQHYRELTDEAHPASLERHYTAYRAWVRAKVECLRDRGGDRGARDRARAALDLCREELRAGRVHLVLVGGLPGTGKSTLARQLVDLDDRDWVLLSSDEVRKEQAGVPRTSGQENAFGEGIYDEAHTARTYAELLHRAGAALDRGLSVVLDASWTGTDQRTRASELARDHGAVLTEVRCVAPEALCLERLGVRRESPHVSDATPEVFRRMAVLAGAWPQALEVDTTGPADAAAARVLRVLGEQPVVPRSGPMDQRYVGPSGAAGPPRGSHPAGAGRTTTPTA